MGAWVHPNTHNEVGGCKKPVAQEPSNRDNSVTILVPENRTNMDSHHHIALLHRVGGHLARVRECWIPHAKRTKALLAQQPSVQARAIANNKDTASVYFASFSFFDGQK